MNFSKRSITNQKSMGFHMEVVWAEDVSQSLIATQSIQPEEEPPSCPRKLHSFLVMASFDTIWHKNIRIPFNKAKILGKN